MAIQPRAKFVQSMIFNLIGVCIGACFNLLTCYSAVKAREHTTVLQVPTTNAPTPGATTVSYNSSASAVSGIWLFFNIMFANAVRFKWPQFQVPVILYSINANIAGIYAPQFPTMAAAEAFVSKLLLAFVTGFGISTVISLFIFPMTSRKIVHARLAAYLGALKGTLAAERAYLQSMETGNLQMKKSGAKEADSPIAAATKKLKGSIAGLTALHSGLAGELPFAKREIAYGKLGAKDMDQIFKLLRQILLPSLGLSSVADIFERVAEGQGWSDEAESPDEIKRRSSNTQWLERVEREKKEWNEVMQALHEPFQELVEAMNEGLTHVGIALEFTARPKVKNPAPKGNDDAPRDTSSDDVEAKAGTGSMPGDRDFGPKLEKRIHVFSDRNKAALRHWCESRGLGDALIRNDSGPGIACPQKDRKHLYMILYMEFLLWSTAKAVLALVKFADAKVESGVMSKKRLIVPGAKRLKKWLISCFVPDEEQSSSETTPDQAEGGSRYVNTGDAFRQKKDPEHLPPTNAWQRFGTFLHLISKGLSSVEVVFGFRVACATMCVAIIGYLEATQNFFIRERIFWAQIMVAISMSVTSGSGVFGFILRSVGTLVACLISLVLWYIAGGRGIPGALLPLLFLIYMPLFLCFVKFPRFIPVFIITVVTTVLVLGYELEADKIGVTTLSSNGQAYHPIYIFAWIRLATVLGGLAIAFIWTYFPYPITAKNTMRMRLGDSLYLLASYYSCIHTTVGFRIEGTGGSPEDKGSPSHQLQKARFKHVGKILTLLGEIRGHLGFSKFEMQIGGRFPREEYEKIITEVNNIFNYMSLVDYATASYVERGYVTDRPESADSDSGSGPIFDSDTWLKDLARVRRSISVTSHEITSSLALMASSIKNGQPLPPYMQPPKPFQLTARIQEIDPDILNVRHVTEHGYAAFAVTQVASRLISHDMEKLLDNVRALVGEVDFSFHPTDEALGKSKEEVVKGKND